MKKTMLRKMTLTAHSSFVLCGVLLLSISGLAEETIQQIETTTKAVTTPKPNTVSTSGIHTTEQTTTNAMPTQKTSSSNIASVSSTLNQTPSSSRKPTKSPTSETHNSTVSKPSTVATTKSKFLLPPSASPSTARSTSKNPGTDSTSRSPATTIGIIILLLIILGIIVIICIIMMLHKKNKKYSFDLHHKQPEDAGIPLSNMEDGAFEPISEFAKVETETEDKNKEEKSADSDVKEPAAENSTSPPETDKPCKEEAGAASDSESFGSQIPLTPLDLCPEVNLGGPPEGEVNLQSCKTSVESLDDQVNENNNNNNNSDEVENQPASQASYWPSSWITMNQSRLSSVERRPLLEAGDGGGTSIADPSDATGQKTEGLKEDGFTDIQLTEFS
ncbi:probable serine/threonine-protein kinase mkcA isoform X2 [Erpetoichthys calabaricus]|uniref:probable serine/threonine-protein kinase mkcA isoform X2 n=1 Tax=Erpetoichthys calabaricus TaxID=27687 RepID=UPI0022344FF7|nr:probable serine/threonine-protein kinase mkcA isoform X2 [Erpetoichthys calabaricus]